jgi:hypothetical protein
LFSLCGVVSIVTNNWAVKPEATFDAFQHLLKGSLGEGVYLGAALRKYRNPTAAGSGVEEPEINPADRKAIYRANTVTYGVPIIRVV